MRASLASLVLLGALCGAARAGDLGETAVFPGGQRLTALVARKPGAVVFDSGPSAALTRDWDTVLLQGESPDPGLSFEASRRRADGTWTAWQPAPAKRFPGGRFWAKSEFPAAAPGALRLRARDAGVAGPHELRIFGVETFARGEQASGGAEIQPSTAPVRPGVHARSEWGARPPKQAYTPHLPYRATVHHTDTKQTFTLADTFAELRFIQDFHMNGRGWNDIAYHFLIDSAGNVVEGRPEGVVGSHVENQNTGNIGVALLGTYHPPQNDPLTSAQLDAAVAVLSYVRAKYGIADSWLRGHRDYKSTDCPGDELYAELPQLRARTAPPAVAPGVPALAPAR